MPTDHITEISLDHLHESPFNPRKRYAGITELAETMRPPNGRVLQPLLVRPIVPPLFAAGGEELAASAVAGYEVVFGHRRRRAALEAGLATVPCMVQAMSDAEARSAQIVENLQREDVHPFEEAEGFATLMREDNLSADELAAQFGKSRSYVYGRLKLLQACPEVRDACLDGHFGTEVALLIARLGSVKIQQQALASVRSRLGNSRLLDGGKDSYRRVRDHLADKFSLRLKDAIFDPEDATLLPTAGACGPCPKRSGNSPVHGDVALEKLNHYSNRPTGPQVCTDVECFAAKKAAHLARKAAELADGGNTVITGNKAKQLVGHINGTLKPGCGYVALQDVQGKLKALPKGTPTPQAVLVLDQRTGKAIKAVKVAELPASAQPQGQAQGRNASSGQHESWEAERARKDRDRDAERQRRAVLAPEIRARMLAQGAGTLGELRLITWLLLASVDWMVEEAALKRHGITRETGHDRESFDWLQPLSPDQLRLVMLDVALEQAIDPEYEANTNRALFEQLAACYDVATDATSSPSPAGSGAPLGETGAAPAPAPKGKGQGKGKSQKDEASAAADAEAMDEASATADAEGAC